MNGLERKNRKGLNAKTPCLSIWMYGHLIENMAMANALIYDSVFTVRTTLP